MVTRWDSIADQDKPIIQGHRIMSIILYCEHMPWLHLGMCDMKTWGQTLKHKYLLHNVFKARVTDIISILKDHHTHDTFLELVKEKKGIKVLEDIWRSEWDFVVMDGMDYNHTLVLKFKKSQDYRPEGPLLERAMQDLVDQPPKSKKTLCFRFYSKSEDQDERLNERP